jgi:hypothetical protein
MVMRCWRLSRGRWLGTTRGCQSNLLLTMESGYCREGDLPNVTSMDDWKNIWCRIAAAACCSGEEERRGCQPG